jgi:hypothetical protein
MADTIYALNDDPERVAIRYYDNGDPEKRAELENQWESFERFDPFTRELYNIRTRPTNHVTEVVSDTLIAPGAAPGRYRIETFIPGKHATTQRALFTVAYGLLVDENNQALLDLEERMVLVDMHNIFDVWYPLGDYVLETNKHPHIGRVRQYDITREEPRTEISFGPVRWIPIPEPGSESGRFDSPVGTPEERQGPFPPGPMFYNKYPVWAGEWFDVNPFLNYYMYGCHTGADLNLPGVSAADKGKPIYAISEGVVTYAGRAGTWGNIIVIEHPDAMVSRHDGRITRQAVYSRYGHVDDNILVRSGEPVTRGQNIGFIGLAAGARSGWHLHFDISYTDVLKRRPSYWPNPRNSRDTMKKEVLMHFLDPLQFIHENH